MFMNLSKVSILVVEDIGPMRQLLANIIKTMGVGKIYTAANGVEGYNQYISKKPDIIVTDWHMPEMDGLQFVEKVRKDPESPRRNIPIIMISGLSAPARIAKARDVGVTEYLVKPFTVQDIAKRISHTIFQPRDFIMTPDFAGPDRRRRKDDDSQGKARRETDKKENDQSAEETRKRTPHKTIKAKKHLQEKVGAGFQLDPWLVTQSEKVLEQASTNFIPLAQSFLEEFKRAIEAAERAQTPSTKIKEDITFSVMQLKANATIFKYGLIGELSSTTLNFLEGSTDVDDLVIEILNAQHTTISHLVSTNARGDGGQAGEALKAELRQAYKRYNKAKALRQQEALKAKSEENKKK